MGHGRRPFGRLRLALALTIDEHDGITAIDVIADPTRLHHLTLAVPGSDLPRTRS